MFRSMKTTHAGLRLSALSFACLSVCSVASAQTNNDPALKETVVTATRTARTADELMQSVDVLTRSEIAQLNAPSMMDLLAMLPGISVSRAGGPGKTTSIYMRGANADHVLVLVNGVRASSATLGEFDWNAFQPEQVERIEVVRGPLASLYGSDAIAGVIQIFTRGHGTGWEVSQTIGSNRMRETNVRAAGGTETRWMVSAGTTGSDGIQMRVVDPKKYPFRSANVNFGLEGTIVPDWSYSLGLTRSEGHEESHISAGPSDFTNQVVDLAVTGKITQGWKQKLSVYSARNELVSPAGFPPSDITTDRQQLSWLHELDVGFGGLTLGIDRLVEGVSNYNPSTGGAVFDRALGSTGLFGQFSTEWEKNDLQIGWRHDRHSSYGSNNTYNVAVGREIASGTRMYFSHGTAFKGPTANDLYWPSDTYTDPDPFGPSGCVTWSYACTFITEGNAALKPEKSRTNEIGLQVDGAVKYKLNLFDTQVTNLIDWAPTVTGSGLTWTETWMPTNIGKASMRGIEGSAAFTLADWRMRVSAARILSRNDSTGDPLDRRPDNSASVQALRAWGNHTLSTAWTLFSARYESTGTRKLNGYGRVDVGDTIKLDGNWSLLLKIDNLFDKQYTLATASGVPYATPGREYYVTLRYTH